MGGRLSALTTFQLFTRDGSPKLVDDSRGLASHVLDRALQVLRPELQANFASELTVTCHQVHLGVVEQRVLVKVRRSHRQPDIIDDPDLSVYIERPGSCAGAGGDGHREEPL